MVETAEAVKAPETDADTSVLRVYEAGYLILPTVAEEELDGVVAEIRALIEKAGGSLIAEGAPISQKLAYTMYVNLGGKRVAYDRASFGWLKFEADGEAAEALRDMLEKNPSILRSILFKTVREDTRAVARTQQGGQGMLREVKRTDTIKSTPAKGAQEGAGEEVSQEALDKSLDELTKD